MSQNQLKSKTSFLDCAQELNLTEFPRGSGNHEKIMKLYLQKRDEEEYYGLTERQKIWKDTLKKFNLKFVRKESELYGKVKKDFEETLTKRGITSNSPPVNSE